MENLLMKILYVLHEGAAGGASKCAVEVIRELQEKGHEITVLIPFSNCEVATMLKESNIPVISQLFFWWQYPTKESFRLRFIFKTGYYLRGIFYRLALRKIKGMHFDIIQSNSSVIDLGAYLSARLGVPHIWHFREFGETDHATKYIAGKEKCMRYVNTHSAKVLFVSQALQNYYADYIDENLCQVLYDGIPKSSLYQKTGTSYAQDGIVHFLTSGALQPGKGQESAILSCAVLRKIGCKNFHLQIAGRDINGYAAHLNQLIVEHNLDDYVHLSGYTTDILGVRKSCDVELVCSNSEAFGRVTIEAMMCSNPVIASIAGANTELVHDEKNGYLFPLGDIDALASKMKSFIDDSSKLSIMGANAYKFSQNFTTSRNVAQLEDLYHSILNKKETHA